MIRSAASKAAWIGRTASMLFGLALVMALVLGMATMALAAVPGDPFKLGKVNSINRVSTLVGSVAGPLLKVDNNGGGPALRLEADSGKAPLTVNPAAGTATNLSADKLDGKHAGEIGVNGLERAFASSATNSDYLKTAVATCPQGKVTVGTGANISTNVLSYANYVVIDETRPGVSDVYVMAYEHEPTAANWRVEATAICATAP